jgi:hypothetical protein
MLKPTNKLKALKVKVLKVKVDEQLHSIFCFLNFSFLVIWIYGIGIIDTIGAD